MSEQFDQTQRLIVVRGNVEGPLENALFRFVLETGTTKTILDRDLLESVGIIPDGFSPGVIISTTAGSVSASQARVPELCALSQKRTDFPVVVHNLAPEMLIDGVLGLDFLRGQHLIIDFRQGLITLS